MKLHVGDIKIPDTLMRTHVSESGIEELARSIKKIGLLNDLIVKKEKKGYVLIAGFRRLLACKMIGLNEVSVKVRRVSDEVTEMMKADENWIREDVDAIDEGRYFKMLLKKYEITQIELSARMHRSEAYVSQRIQATEWPPEVTEALESNLIKFSVAREMANVKDRTRRRALLAQAIKSGVSPGVAAEWRRSANSTPDMTQSKIVPGESKKSFEGALEHDAVCMTCYKPLRTNELKYFNVCGLCSDVIRIGMDERIFDAIAAEETDKASDK